MLSRLALAPRLATAAARLSRPAVSPIVRARAAAPLLPWARSFADKPKQSGKQPSSSKPTPPDSAAESSGDAAPKEAQPKDEPEQIPFDKLPDLTQGIPSTLDQEMSSRRGRADSALEAVEPEAEGRGGRGGRRDEYVSTSERNRRWWTRFLLATTAAGGALSLVYMGRDWDDVIEAQRHPDIPNGWGISLWWQRVRARMGESVSYYQDPAFDKLLPDPDPSFERPYTLCLSLDDLLVHSEWSREHGWRVAKRPGMDYFVRYLSQYYELVLFTTVPFAMGEPIVRKLDPFRFIMWPLYREATKYEDGEIVKDLSYLNRDLSKVIIIDTKASHVRKQPENAIILDPWKGEAKDQDLVGLIPFLEYIHTMQYSDVRKVLKSFEGKHIPTEFARREAIARKEFNKQLEAQKSKHSKPSGMGALGNLLGLKPSNMSMTMAAEGEQNPTEAFAQGKMLQDLARERGQRNYELLEKEIRENGEKWLKEEQQAMEKAQQEAMNSMMGSFSGWFGPKPEAGAGGDKKA
ncbi:mitochondrial inner membrane protein required for protein import [Purpureocillium takamizusanense]|uniref:Mitochondrial import inner membrane translocase subunit TIM50 n=1 Tax=Purpureocillium takamizusanense TaxID=2060973 RepID=A0A9Q8VF35_9HYPO|nr:mitochondrial inner membrane protein required for protein import [Purpureocillium takamizusanense]UNI22971.1 mitochondrial inner membrane protein required for protein import [Purpureocillium takamizusanense]